MGAERVAAFSRHPLRLGQLIQATAPRWGRGLALAAMLSALSVGPMLVMAQGDSGQGASGQQGLTEAWDSEAGFDCSVLEGVATPESAEAWYEFSLWANHCHIFQARAVRISNDGVRSLMLSHDIQNGFEREAAHFLDGPPLILERRGRIGRGGWAEEGSEVPASPTAIMTHLGDHYRLSLSGEERIAGRHAVRLDIESLDSMRYSHRLWLDRATALPLKRLLLDEDGRVIETFQITELKQPHLYAGHVRLDDLRQAPPDPWAPGWLPPGYSPQPVATRSSVHNDAVGHRLFSDGLSSLSLFVEPLSEEGRALVPGMHRLGISYAAVRHGDVGGQTMQIVAMGELPPRVLLRIVEHVEWRPDRLALDADDESSAEAMP